MTVRSGSVAWGRRPAFGPRRPRPRTVATITLLAALGVVAMVGRTGVFGGVHIARPGPAAPAEVQAARTLEGRVLVGIKRTFVLLAADHQRAAAVQLRRTATAERAISNWLRARPSFARVNKGAVGCVIETGERLVLDNARFGAALRTDAITAQASRRLRLDLGEAGNCLQTGD